MMVTYQTLAGMDLESAKVLLDNGTENTNTTAALMACQSVEKSLKFVLAKSINHPGMKISKEEVIGLMKTHNIKKIMYSCLDVFTDLYRLKSEIIEISEVFFQSRYPGEFKMLSREQAQSHFNTAVEVYKCCEIVLAGGRY